MMAHRFSPLAIPLLFSIFPSSAFATPRLAATYGQDCQLCHVNPTGGGMRNTYVTNYIGPAELPLKPIPAHEQSRWPKAKLNEQISIGADLRLLYLATDNATTAVGNLDNTFFEMQGDFYVAFEPDPEFVLYLDRGIGSEFEVFALGRILPQHGYLKAGRFVPDIGWRWDDHNHYTREYLDLDFPGATQTGLETGFFPGPFALSAGIYNGNDGSQFDDNPQKMITGKALYRMPLGGANMALAGSTRWDHREDGRERLWGIQAEAGWGPVAYVGDFFGRRLEPYPEEDTASLVAHELPHSRTWSWIMSQEVDVRPIQGLDLYVGYDFFDPDLDHETGTRQRFSIGSRIYLRHFLKVEPIFRTQRDRTSGTKTTDERFEVILHAFY